MQTFYTLSLIVFILVGILISLSILFLITSLTNKTHAETVFLETQNARQQVQVIPDELDYISKIEASVAFLNFINTLIENEINKTFTSLDKINSRYDLKNLDTDAANIAKKIFDSLNKEITFSTNNLIITDEYIMRHITDEAIIRLLDKSSKYNNKLTLVM